MQKIHKIIFLTFLLVIFSCEDQDLFVSCPDCTEQEPVGTSLEVKLDLSSFGYETSVNVYEGNLDDSILYTSYKTTYQTNMTIPVSLNKKYTVTATYYVNDNYYIAVDSATPRVKYDKTDCDDPCYYVYDRNIDLRIKYTK